MSQQYSDPNRETDPHALPDIEVFYVPVTEFVRAKVSEWPYERVREEMDNTNENTDEEWISASVRLVGWYYWSCFPGCLPDSDPVGPFDTEDAAITAMRDEFGE